MSNSSDTYKTYQLGQKILDNMYDDIHSQNFEQQRSMTDGVFNQLRKLSANMDSKGHSTRQTQSVGKNKKHFENVKTLYHQTDQQSAILILSSRKMKRGSTGLAGGGVYFATSETDTMHKAHSTGCVLKCQVALGRVKRIKSNGNKSITFTQLKKEGFDSVEIPRPGGTEYVVYDWDQVKDIKYCSFT